VLLQPGGTPQRHSHPQDRAQPVGRPRKES
jgi:hypothetical protein